MPQTNDTSDRIREAAVMLFARSGYHATGIREIASEAGITTAALYHYMGSKQDLLMEIMRLAMRDLIGSTEAALGSASSATERLCAFVTASVKYHGEHQLVARVADHELPALDAPRLAAIIELRDGYERMWAQTIADGCADGSFKIDNQHMFRLAVLQMCTGVATWYSPRGEIPLDVIAGSFADMVLAMAQS